MRLQIFVEDEKVEAYRVLASKALGLPVTVRSHEAVIRVIKIKIEELASLDGLLDLTQRAVRGGSDTILFIMDQEGPRSVDRPVKLEAFRRAFQQLCRNLAQRPDGDPLRGVNVIRIICKRCLESWLASDLQAVVEFARGRHGLDYRPTAGRTENLSPEQAMDRIAQTIREVGRRTGSRHHASLTSQAAKSLGKDIALHVVPDRARRNNASLAYFFDMVQGRRNGCDQPCPE